VKYLRIMYIILSKREKETISIFEDFESFTMSNELKHHHINISQDTATYM
jgi:hypothetical protein